MAALVAFAEMFVISLLLMVATMDGNAGPSEGRIETPLPDAGWRLVTDGVMGGVSSGRLSRQRRAGRDCVCLAGEVRTENNGGFIQLALDLEERFATLAGDHEGIRLEVLGNGEEYNVHLRTRDLWLPWQSYRASFATTGNWQAIELPFSRFAPYRTTRALRVDRLKRIGIVAIGRAFTADLCVGSLVLYRGDG